MTIRRTRKPLHRLSPTELREWFIGRIKFSDGCWEWVGDHNYKGYGILKIAGKRISAHRLSYSIFVGEIRDFHVLHHCDNPGCVRPTHLFLGTEADNSKDAAQKDRRRQKLTILQVKAIRGLLAAGWKQLKIAKVFGVCQSNISRMKNRTRRPHVP